MSPELEIAAGLGCLALGLGYLYRPDIIERLNAILRDYLFNDAHIALERKKWGAFLLLMSFLFIYMGLSSVWH